MTDLNIVVTGMGIVSAAGMDIESVWNAILRGQTGLAPLTSLSPSRWANQPIGEICADLTSLGAPRAGSRSYHLAWLAIGQALTQAGWQSQDHDWVRGAGLILGATTGGIRGSEESLEKWLVSSQRRRRPLAWHECASSTDLCARRLQLEGPCTTVSTACSSGALAIAMAAEALLTGEADRMIAGGVDALSRLTINGFNSLMLVDPAGCRPFDAKRAGMNLGEGAAAVTLELESRARKRGAPILARLSGWGTSCDAHHATAPHPAGEGARAAIEKALARARIAPNEIGYINAHGTGTRDNDLTEGRALKSIFGSGVPPFSSTKGTFGHTLAASGAIEAVVSILSLTNHQLPPSLGFENVDPEIGLTPLTKLTPAMPSYVMSNSFGFGGNNVTLIFGDAEVESSSPIDLPKRTAQIFVSGLGVAMPAGCRPENLYSAAAAGQVERRSADGADTLPEAKILAYRCAELPEQEELEANKRRRMNQLLKMAVIATRRARGDSKQPPGERTAICLGTGLGCLTDTGDFLANMIAAKEAAPMPAKFIRSVHNAPAAQAAMEIGARGLNSCPTHREISFETALWQAIGELRFGRADIAYAGACDELSPYLIGAGRAFGWWTDDPGPIEPFKSRGEPSHRQSIDPHRLPTPGEGAVVVSLSADLGGKVPPNVRARVGLCSFGRWRRDLSCEFDAEAESAWIESALRKNDISIDEIDLLLTGANGRTELDFMYLRAHAALEKRAARSIPLAAYKQLCGEFASASAIGFALAVGIVEGNVAGDDLCAGRVPSVPKPCRTVLLYTLSLEGSRAITVVRSVEGA